MGKSTHFIGQPVIGQLLKLIPKDIVLSISRSEGGEHYTKKFDAWTQLVTELYAIIKRFDSLREITMSMQAEARKLRHLGITTMPRRSTIADANRRRPAVIYERLYRFLYDMYHHELSSDSRRHKGAKWMDRLMIVDSTTVSLFSNKTFKGAGRNPIRGKKKGGIKVHTVIKANEGVPCDVNFTSAATHDSCMFYPSYFNRGDIVAIDRAYINYDKFEQLSQKEVVYVTKMKKGLTYKILEDTMYQTPEGLMGTRIQKVSFSKPKPRERGGEGAEREILTHYARIITYTDEDRKSGLVSLLTNDMDMDPEEIIAIYGKRWDIELLFKQIKQNFPLRYFYGESANAIKIQIWITLIANLLLSVLQKRLTRSWSFSGLATQLRTILMYYVDVYSLLNHPDKDWEELVQNADEGPPGAEPELWTKEELACL